MRITAIIIGLLIVALVVPCWAGQSKRLVTDPKSPAVYDTYKSALHVKAHGSSCKSMPTFADTNAINRTWSIIGGDGIDVFYVLYDYDSLLVFEFGLNWPADWGTGEFQKCSGPIQVGAIQYPGDGVSLAFPDCQISQWAGGTRPNIWTYCWVWLIPQSAGEIEILPSPASGDLCIIDCREPSALREKHNPMTVYHAGVNIDPYEGPPKYATEPSTWGAIKAIFK